MAGTKGSSTVISGGAVGGATTGGWIGAIAGATVGLTEWIFNAINGYDYYDDLVDQKKQERDLALEDLELQYNNAKDTALKNAARSDALSTNNEQTLTADFNSALSSLQNQQQQEGFAFNKEAQAAGAAKGNELASASFSGTRTSSVNDAIDMEAAQNSAQLQLEEEAQRRNDARTLGNSIASLASNTFNIQADRTEASDLRNSFNEGGYNYEQYMNSKERVKLQYSQALDQLRNARDQYTGWNAVVGATTATLTGATSGAQTMSNLYSYAEDTTVGNWLNKIDTWVKNHTINFSN